MAARWRLSQVREALGESGSDAEARAWFASFNVKRPDRMLRIFAPGFEDPRSDTEAGPNAEVDVSLRKERRSI